MFGVAEISAGHEGRCRASGLQFHGDQLVPVRA
jgi:hypothetical protein